MSYNTVEAGLATVIKLADGFDSSNVTQGDYRILAKGLSKAVVLSPGSFSSEVVAAPRRLRQSWIVDLDLFIPFTDEISSAAASVRSVRQTIMDKIDQYPTLNGTSGVINAFIASGSEPSAWRGENRRWWVQTLRVEIEERSTVSIAE